jgi:hypothetical protein
MHTTFFKENVVGRLHWGALNIDEEFLLKHLKK